MGHTRRREMRRAKNADIEMISQYWDEPVDMVAADMSPSGIFISSDLLLEVGEPIVACFKLPGHKLEFQLFGEVVWIAMPRRWSDFGLAGMGVEFLNTTPLERLSMRHSLRGVPPPLPYNSLAPRGAVSKLTA